MKGQYHFYLNSLLDTIIRIENESKNPELGEKTIFTHEHHLLLLEKLVSDGYIKLLGGSNYVATIEGRLFFERGGYIQQQKDIQLNRIYKWIFNIAVGFGTAIMAFQSILQICKWYN